MVNKQYHLFRGDSYPEKEKAPRGACINQFNVHQITSSASP
jgi:hypothetical protein